MPPPKIANAKGNGNIVCHLSEHLCDLCHTHRPITVVICLDKRDALDQHDQFKTCCDLKKYLDSVVEDWLNKQTNIEKTPHKISIVIQVIQFESWLLSNTTGMRNIVPKLHGIEKNIPIIKKNCDDEITNPAKCLQSIFPETNIKAPWFPHEIVLNGSVDDMVNRSQSFHKFYRDCLHFLKYYSDLS